MYAIAFPRAKPGATCHLVEQTLANSGYHAIVDLDAEGAWKSELARATRGSTFGTADTKFRYIGLFDYTRESHSSDGTRLGRFVERVADIDAAKVTL